MARQVFPQDRTAWRYGAPNTALVNGAGAILTVFTDQASTTLASIDTYPFLVPIPDSQIVVGADSLLPEFYGPLGFKVLWLKAPGAPSYAIAARFEDRLTEIEFDLAGIGSGTGNIAWRHIQPVPSDTWTITHNTGVRFGGIRVRTSAGDDIEMEVVTQTESVVVLRADAAFSGEAYLS